MKKPGLSCFLLGLLFLGLAPLSQGKTIKFATLAPEGSVWMKALRRGASDLQKASGGKLTLKYFPGGIAGDEADVVRKMKLGQIHAAGMTGVGLAEILPEIQVLELPLLFQSPEEVDAVLEKVLPALQERFVEKGFRLLGLSETGFVHFYSSFPLEKLSDLSQSSSNVWIWESDRLHKSFYEALSFQPVALGVPDVLTGLQTGMINAINGPPAAVVALQWHTRVQAMTKENLWWVPGGVVISERIWQTLTPEEQEVLSTVSLEMSRELRLLARRDNDKAFEALESRGIQVSPGWTDAERSQLEDAARKVREQLVGKMFSQEVLQTVLDSIESVRHPKGN